MTPQRHVFSALISRSFIFALILVTAASPGLRAQTAPGTATDVHLHKFQPKVTPEGTSSLAANQSLTQDQINAKIGQQILSIEQEKASRTAAQQRIDSNVLYTIRMLQGQAPAPGITSIGTDVELDDNNNVAVDITANVTDELVQKLQSAGAQIIFSHAGYHSIRAIIPPDQIEAIAGMPDVTFIGPRARSMTEHVDKGPRNSALSRWRLIPGFPEREAKVRRKLAAALQNPQGVFTGQGIVTTEGDLTHRAFDARGTFGVNGAGLKIGVLSDSANATGALNFAQASGDLPQGCPGTGGPCLTVVQDNLTEGATDEGTAMMEIIYDMAPGASLFFATGDNGEASFAQNITNLRSVQKCDIVVDDIFYFDEPVFQDGIIAQAVSGVVASGGLYFSAAGNEGNVDSNTAGYYEGDFNDAGSTLTIPGNQKTGTVHNFGTQGNPLSGDTVTSGGEEFTLNWADPQGGSANDYDLFLVNTSGTVVGQSTNVQNGLQNPYEQIGTSNFFSGYQLIVFKTHSAAVRAFALNTLRGTMTVVTPGQLHGHTAVVGTGMYSVAATPAAVAFAPGTPTGPFPAPFSTSNVVEPFVSDGPRRVFFNADGTAITPGNFLFGTNGGTVRNKPDITAADGVSTTLPGASGLNPFFGTSAAAPHAAAVAALVKSANPALTQAQIQTALESTALDIMATGFDRDSGNGIVMAYPAVASLGVPGTANPEIGTVTATQNPGNGDGIIKAGEGAKLVIQLKNTSGVMPATGITATLSSPLIPVTLPAISAYADIPSGSVGGTNLSPFTFTLPSDFACSQSAFFILTVNFSGSSQRVLEFSIPVAALTFTGTLGTTPAGIPGITTATGTQVNRISRSGTPSTCTVPKAFPGVINPPVGSRAFNSYTVTPPHVGCLGTTFTAANGINMFQAVYAGAFDPNNIGTNFAGDAGYSGNTTNCGDSILAPGTPMSVVISDVTGNSVGSPYTLQLPVCVIQSTVHQTPVALVQNVTVMAATVGGSANANINNGSSVSDGGPFTITQAPAGPYPHGVTNVLLTIVDDEGATAQASATVTVVDPGPDMTVAVSHVGTFAQGETGAMYTITATNSGPLPTTAQVNVADNLPDGLTATGISGTGWTCTATPLSCNRSDVLQSGMSFLPITLTVNVAANANSVVVNSVTVSGGGESITNNDTGTDSASVTQFPDMTTRVSNPLNFAQGEIGATYSIQVSNAGAAPTTGAMNLVDTLPPSLTATAMSGTGWTCTVATVSCTRNDSFPADSSLPGITLTVTVANNAPPSVTNVVTVSGGGEIYLADDSSSDLTMILASSPATANPSTGMITFTAQSVGVQSPPQSMTVNNNGGASLIFSVNPSITGTNASDFAIANGSTCVTGTPVQAAGGICMMAITFTPSGPGQRGPATLTFTDNATPSTQTVTLVGSGPDYSVSGPSSPVTVSAGGTANFTITITPGSVGFTNNVTFSQTGAPTTGTTISFNPPSVSPGNASISTTLSIVTSSRTIGAAPPVEIRPETPIPFAIVTFLAALLTGVLLMLRRMIRRRQFVMAGIGITLFLTALWVAGCGGGGTGGGGGPTINPNGTPAGTYTIMVTATSGSDTHTTTVTLTVQ